jgi:hypothetical protein
MVGGNRRRRVDSLCNWGIGGWGEGDIEDGLSGGDEGDTGIRSSREGTGDVETSYFAQVGIPRHANPA